MNRYFWNATNSKGFCKMCEKALYTNGNVGEVEGYCDKCLETNRKELSTKQYKNLTTKLSNLDWG